MYRTYLRIPEAQRPPLPDRSVLSSSEWESGMKKIWTDRQATLKEAMDNIVDVPDVLAEVRTDEEGKDEIGNAVIS